ncbi:MAG: copper resistance protein CopC [Armatimonadota bacterium]|nr:copper resistance protein CopC [Armatimonadota bacterium]MDR5697075.1 copper resistance protein CopC [Armatimonadota bacterium]
MRTYRIAACLILLLTGAACATALAHARLLKSEPRHGATLRSPPRVVRAWFNEELDPATSAISVWDGRGRRVDDGKGGVELDNLDRNTMAARLRPVGAGRYTVRWKAVSADDGYVARGEFRFTVRP